MLNKAHSQLSRTRRLWERRPRWLAGLVFAFVWTLTLGGAIVPPALTLTWDPNTEPDLEGYLLHYGLASGSYTETLDVGTSTSAEVLGLVPGNTYYFAVTAYNVEGLEGPPSNEVSYRVPIPPPPSLLAQNLQPDVGEGGAEVVVSDDRPLPDGSYQFRVRAMSASSVTISISSDLVSWRLLGEVENPTGVLLLRDLEGIALEQRFYRVEPGP